MSSPHPDPPRDGGGRVCEDAGFVVEQPALDREAAAKAGQGSVRADDAVAGKHDTNGVGAVRGADGSGGGRDTQLGRLVAVGRSGTEWNLGQRAPGGDLEACAVEIERDVECGPLPGEVLIELPGCGLEDRMVRIAVRSSADSRAFQGGCRPDNRPQSMVGRDQRQLANRGRMGGGVQHRLVLHH